MKNTTLATLTALAALSIFAAAWAAPPNAPEVDSTAPAASTAPPVVNAAQTGEPDFKPRLLEIAKSYQAFGRVDDETRWAPTLCAAPRSGPRMPSLARVSKSDDNTTHGQKVYYVFAKEQRAYLSSQERNTQPLGQVLVKESWKPEKVELDHVPVIDRESVRALAPVANANRNGKDEPPQEGGRYFPYVKKEGAIYRAHEQSDLFIMFKLGPSTGGTDEGWVYGTVTADGKTVTSAGRVESCMACHRETKNDRVFGLPPAAKDFPETAGSRAK